MIITLGDMKDCDECKDPTKKRVGTSFDCDGPGSVAPVYECDNTTCKRKQNAHARYIIGCAFEQMKGGSGID